MVVSAASESQDGQPLPFDAILSHMGTLFGLTELAMWVILYEMGCYKKKGVGFIINIQGWDDLKYEFKVKSFIEVSKSRLDGKQCTYSRLGFQKDKPTVIWKKYESQEIKKHPAAISSRASTKFVIANPASSLLYAEQEKLLVSRGEMEADLMTMMTGSGGSGSSTPLKANVVKGGGGGGGFGGGGDGANGSKKSLLKTQAKSHAKVLKEEGVVRIDNVLSPSLADSIRTHVYKMRAESEGLVRDGTLPSLARFANVLLKENRCDMTIPIGPTWVANALVAILVHSPVGMTFQNLLGKHAILYEWSCMMSDPNSQRQVVHPDTPAHDDQQPVLYTCFIALQDITMDMGPTTWLPRTHTSEMHEQFKDETIPSSSSSSLKYDKDDNDDNGVTTTTTTTTTTTSPKDELLKTQPKVLGTLSKGSCAIFDSRVLHCGGANVSEKSRALLYCSFQNPSIVHVGNPGSIRKDMIGKWNFQELQKELECFAKGKPTKRLISSTTTTTDE